MTHFEQEYRDRLGVVCGRGRDDTFSANVSQLN